MDYLLLWSNNITKQDCGIIKTLLDMSLTVKVMDGMI